MDEAAEQLRKINEKVDLIQTENKFIAKRLAKDIDQRERSENGAHRIGSLLDQVLELSEADKRQNNEVSEMIFAILETNRKISELNQIITELHKSDGNLSSLVEDVDQEVNEVNSLFTSGATSCVPGNSVSEDVVEELSISENKPENRELTKREPIQFEEKTDDINICSSESVSLTIDGNTEVNALHHLETEAKESASSEEYVLDQKSEDQVIQISALTEDAENKTSSGTDGGFTEMLSTANGETEPTTKIGEASDSSKGLSESAKEWKDKLSQSDQDSLKKLRKKKTAIEVDNRCSVMIEEKSQRKTETREKGDIEDILPYVVSEARHSPPLAQTGRVENDYWLKQAAFEAATQQSMQHQQGGGLDIIFVLDTSASMEGEGMRQMKGVVTDILNECERRSALDVNVAIITFGHENKFHRHCSNRYYNLKRSLDELQCGGPSPLGAGLLLTTGTRGSAGTSKVRNWYVQPRIVLISDGIITDFHYPEGPEKMHPGGDNREIVAELLRVSQSVGDRNAILCVPVGDPDMSNLEMISGLSNGGKIVHLHEAKKIGRFPHNVIIAAELNEIMKTCDKMDRANFQTMMSTIISDSGLTDSDWDDIYEMVSSTRTEFKSSAERSEEEQDVEYQERYSYMPPIGTRVKRGPEWRWGDQDTHGPGTVIGHSTRPGHINVRWDSGNAYPYPYGANGEFSIVVCDSPRQLDDQMIAVGCLVTRGPDWEWGDQDGGDGSIGVVYRVNDVAIIHVRWPNGAKSNYRFGFDGKFDVKICDPFSSEVKRVLKQQATTASASNFTPEPASGSSKNFDPLNQFQPNFKQSMGNGESRLYRVTPFSKEKKLETKIDSSDQEPQMTFEEIRRTGSSLNIMDLAPPAKHTVWSDFPISTPDTNRSSSLRVNQNLANGKQNATASDIEHTTRDGHSNPNAQTKQNPPMEDSVSMEMPHEGLSEQKECIQGSPKESLEQVIDDKDFKPVQLIGQANAHGQLSGDTTEKNMDSVTYSETSDKQLEPSLETSTKNKSCDQVPRWEWKHPHGHWTSYPEDIQEKLKKNFLKNPKSTVLISMGESHFRVVFSKNKHINTENKESAEIRRIYE